MSHIKQNGASAAGSDVTLMMLMSKFHLIDLSPVKVNSNYIVLVVYIALLLNDISAIYEVDNINTVQMT
jgi:hypothetical protein